jgi:hypothetical protein
MSIQVRTSEPVQVQAPAQEQTTQSAPKAEGSSEQKEAAESDTAESEAKEETIEDESESGSKDEDSTEEDGDTEAKDSEKDRPKKKGGFQRRIDKLNARATAAQQEAEYWKQQALKGAGADKTQANEPTQKAEPVAAQGKPNPENFETHAEYVEALTDWKLEQREKARIEQDQKSKLKSEHERTMKAHAERVTAFAEKTEDFHEAIAELDDIPMSPSVAELLVSSENGPELMYELAKNKAEFERINRLYPLAAARELGKIEAKIAKASKESKPEIKKQTNAPKPIEPVGTAKGNGKKSIFDADLSQAEYERLRREQNKRKGA